MNTPKRVLSNSEGTETGRKISQGWNIPGWLLGRRKSTVDSLEGWVDSGKDAEGFLDKDGSTRVKIWWGCSRYFYLPNECISWNIALISFHTLFLFCFSQPSASRANAEFSCNSLEISVM